jgi:dolichol-phosphate mannosyltransferase
VKPRVSIVITACDEADSIVSCLDRVFEAVTLPCEVLVVYDTPDDTTVPYLEKYAAAESRLTPLLNGLGRGPARAIRAGIAAAAGDTVVVTMADGCDDAEQIDSLVKLVERGVVVAAASRYARTGQQVGGSFPKAMLSRLAGVSLFWLARVGTRDATNSFKAYSKKFIGDVGIESDDGFEVGIELVAKARRLRLPVAELPTIWLERQFGVSHFRLLQWLPRYFRWYRFAFGPPLSLDELKRRSARL